MPIYLIYILTCITNEKPYVGLTKKSLEQRFLEHCQAAERGSPFAIHAAIRKYGKNNWRKEASAYLSSEKEAEKAEIDLIALKQSNVAGKGYNMTSGGDGIKNLKRTAKHRQAISEALKGHPVSEETRRKLSAYCGPKASFYGRKQSPEWCAMMEKLRKENHPMQGVVGSANPNAKEYEVTFPTGEKRRIKGLAEFCRQHNLHDGAMVRVAQGKANHHKGYRCKKIDNQS